MLGIMILVTLQEVSQKVNKSLPQVYDPVTKLVRTSVEHKNFYYHFVLDATQEEYNAATPMVRSQILTTICSKPQEKSILLDYKANIVYRYESVKGVSLGEFMIKPEQCLKK